MSPPTLSLSLIHISVPFFIYDSRSEKHNNIESYTEEECRKTGLYIPRGHDLMQILTADDSEKEAAKLRCV